MALIATARGSAWEIPMLLAATAGTRRSETLALAWSAMDLERGRVTVTRNLQRVPGEGLRFFEPKTKSSRRTIILSAFAVLVLRQWRKAQAERRLLLGRGGRTTTWSATGGTAGSWTPTPSLTPRSG